MKFLRGLIFASCLLIASFATAQDKPAPKGYDLGSCAPGQFAAAHVVVVNKDLKIDWISTAPGVTEKQDHPVLYEFQSKDDLGSHYLYVNAKKRKLELVLNFKNSVGVFSVDGEAQAVIFIMEDDDASKLAENAMQEYKSCVELVNGASDN
jgi:hypothetical protein